MCHITIKIVTCPRSFTQNQYPTHVMKLLTDEHKDYPCVLINDGYELWDVQGNTHYQYSLYRAQVMGYQWFFSEFDEVEYNLIKETHDTKLYLPSKNGKLFIPFPIETNNKLVQFFHKETRHKEIYEENGFFGQQTPSNNCSMGESSEMQEAGEDEEILVSK